MNRRVDPLTVQIQIRQVGLPYPDPCRPGLRLDVRAEGADLRTTLVMGVDGLTTREADALSTAPIVLGLLHSPPITWVTFHTVGLEYDAPYTLGLELDADVDRVLDHLAAIATGASPPPQTLDLHCVDTRTGRLALMRRLRVSQEWMRFLGLSLAANSETISLAESSAAIDRDYDRWPSTQALTDAADGVEVVHGAETFSTEVTHCRV